MLRRSTSTHRHLHDNQLIVFNGKKKHCDTKDNNVNINRYRNFCKELLNVKFHIFKFFYHSSLLKENISNYSKKKFSPDFIYLLTFFFNFQKYPQTVNFDTSF